MHSAKTPTGESLRLTHCSRSSAKVDRVVAQTDPPRTLDNVVVSMEQETRAALP